MLFIGVGALFVMMALGFIFLRSGPLLIILQVIEAAVLLAWAGHYLKEYLHDRSPEHLREVVMLAALGVVALAILGVEIRRELAWTLSERQQQKIANAVKPISGTTVNLLWLDSDPNSKGFATGLLGALQKGGIHVQANISISLDEGVSEGMTVMLPDDQVVRNVFAEVFRIAGQKLKVLPDKSQRPEIHVLLKPR